jgi:glutamate formiminotransferase
VFQAVQAAAERSGAGISGTELIGLIPQKALDGAASCGLQFENFHPELILDEQLKRKLG